jgi:hypothetical protein
MESNKYILTDIQAVLQENHREFSLLNIYKGVPLLCRARLDRVADEAAYFTVQPPESATLKLESTTLLLSDGLLEPLEAQVQCIDLASGEFRLSGFSYAGSKFANRRELRVEPKEKLPVEIAADSHTLHGEVADISVRGLGLRLPLAELTVLFVPGKTVAITLHLRDKEDGEEKQVVVRLEGKIRSVIRTKTYLRLAIEFTGAVPEKATIIRYVMLRRAEIMGEIRQLYEAAIKL